MTQIHIENISISVRLTTQRNANIEIILTIVYSLLTVRIHYVLSIASFHHFNSIEGCVVDSFVFGTRSSHKKSTTS